MHPFVPKHTRRDGPEGKIQSEIIDKLESFGWFVQVILGNALQNGMPDLFASHPRFGQKWIEVKNPAGFSFTERQQQKFPVLHAHGVGIWILFSAEDSELIKLTKPANWFEIFFTYQAGCGRKR